MTMNTLEEALDKNFELIFDLQYKRRHFAGIGTNKAKRRLNKLALDNPIAKAVRVALEIEDKNISAKDSWGKYQQRIYDVKTKLIFDLVSLFQQENWIYGVQPVDGPTSHVIYFEVPGCEQISWHITTEHILPAYNKKWDGKENSTLDKLEMITREILTKENHVSLPN